MHRLRSHLAIVALAITTTVTVTASAEGPASLGGGIPKPPSALPWYVGIGAGVGYPTLETPEVVQGGTVAATLTFHGGYTFGERLNVGVEWTAVETGVGRDTPGEQFEIGYQPQAECTVCKPKVPGADVIATSLVMSTVGPRFEFAPFGRDGLFVGGLAGVAFMIGLQPETGFGFGGRVGYRLRPTNVLTLSLEAGFQGQLYGDASMYMPYGAAVVRPYF